MALADLCVKGISLAAIKLKIIGLVECLKWQITC
jgi:hypothetical protein